MRNISNKAVTFVQMRILIRWECIQGTIMVVPAQTITRKEYQRLRDYLIAIIREECGGSNVQFAVNPEGGEGYGY